MSEVVLKNANGYICVYDERSDEVIVNVEDRVMGLTRTPGVQREAERIRDRYQDLPRPFKDDDLAVATDDIDGLSMSKKYRVIRCYVKPETESGWEVVVGVATKTGVGKELPVAFDAGIFEAIEAEDA